MWNRRSKDHSHKTYYSYNQSLILQYSYDAYRQPSSGARTVCGSLSKWIPCWMDWLYYGWSRPLDSIHCMRLQRTRLRLLVSTGIETISTNPDKGNFQVSIYQEWCGINTQ